MTTPRPAYLDFNLRLAAEQDGAYEALLFDSPAGAASRMFPLPARQELETWRERLAGAAARLPENQPRRAAPAREAQAFGALLFDAVFAGALLQAYDQSLSTALAQGANLRLRLRIVDPLLASLPWELLFDARGQQFVALAPNTVLLRTVESLQPPQALTLEAPLHVLAMGASPADLPPLDLAGEQRRLTEAFAGLGAAANFEWLAGQDWRSLQDALQRQPRHLLHFAGHGAYNLSTHEGVLLFADEHNAADPRPADELALLLAAHPSLRLVVLNACEGAKNNSGSSMDAGVAALLVQRGAPAVLAMQYVIEAQQAAEFSRSFYAAVGAGLAFDVACAEARKALRLAAPGSLQWAAPVLLLRNAEEPASPPLRQRWDGRQPYVGLQAFGEDNAHLFFGRQQLVDDLVGCVAAARFLCVAGPSGSGKSSLMQAGLLHALKSGRLPGSSNWLYATLAPGTDPIEQLALAASRLAKDPAAGDRLRQAAKSAPGEAETQRRLAVALHSEAEILLSAGPDQRLVLYIDQFEELFTRTADTALRTAFLDLLAGAARREQGRVIVVISLRSDFLSHCSSHAALRSLINQQFVLVGAMQPKELAQAVVLPALTVGAGIEPELTRQIVAEMTHEPGALPLMQFALKDLFDAASLGKRRGDVVQLTLEGYWSRGGLHESLQRHASSVLAALPPEQQNQARLVFERLVEIGRGAPDTRRVAGLDELENVGDPQQVDAVVNAFLKARLLTTAEPTQNEVSAVTVAHETLLVAWPWLAKLIDENRELIRLQNTIERDADEWAAAAKAASYLYADARLQMIENAQERKHLLLSDAASAFLEASRAEVDRRKAMVEALRESELVQTRKARDRLRWLLAAAVALLVVFVGAGVWIQNQNQALDAQTRQAQVHALAALARAAVSAEKPEPRLALEHAYNALLLAENAPLNVRSAAEDAAHYALRFDRLAAVTPVGENNVQLGAAALTPSGELLVAGASDGAVYQWRVGADGDLEPLAPIKCYPERVVDVAVASQRLAIAYESGMVCVWDLALNRQVLLQRLGAATIALREDATLLAAGGAENAVELCTLAGDKPKCSERFSAPGGRVRDLAFDGTGAYLAVATDSAVLWRDVAQKRTLWLQEALVNPDQLAVGRTVTHLALSRNAAWLAAAVDGVVHLWRSNPDPPANPGFTLFDRWPAHRGIVSAFAFDPAGRCLASAADDQSIKVWELEQRRTPLLLSGFGMPAEGLAFLPHPQEKGGLAFPCGPALYSTGGDPVLRTWRLGPSRDQWTSAVYSAPVESIAFAGGAATLLAAADDSGQISVVDYIREQTVWQKPLHTARANAVAFSPDGRLLASSGYDDKVVLVDAATGANPTLLEHTGDVLTLAFSPAGDLLASAGRDNRIRLWHPDTGQEATPPILVGEEVRGLAFSPSGDLLAAANTSVVRVWRLADRQLLAILDYHHSSEWTLTVEFLHEDVVLTGGEAGALYVWRLTPGSLLLSEPERVILLDSGRVTGLAQSNGGEWVAAATQHGEAVLLDTQTWSIQQRLSTDRELGNTFNDLGFSPDGRFLAAASENFAVYFYLLGPPAALRDMTTRRYQLYQ